MKQKHTQAKKARRASGFCKESSSKVQSRQRALKREGLQTKRPHTFGEQVSYIQRIFLKKDRFGGPIIRFIKHSTVETQSQE